MENEEMMNVPEEENNSFDGLPSEGTGGDAGYDDGMADGGKGTDDWYSDPDAKASESPRVKKLLDQLTDDGTNDTEAMLEDDDPAKAGFSPEQARDESGLRAKTAEEEEMELLKNVKSERGRERIKSIISARKEAEMQRSVAQSEMENFRNLIGMTGLDKSDLAMTMEYGRLLNKGDDESLQMALNMVEEQREMICRKLGRAAPGVDLLSDLPELKSAVEKRELSMDHALKLAKYEREQRMKRQFESADMERVRQSETLINSLQDISTSCDNYFKQYEREADYPAKMRRIAGYFADPDRLNEFLRTIPPPMWFNQLKFMYENMAVPSPKNDYTPQPLRSRSIATGPVADTSNMSHLDRILKRMDDMGI